MAKIYISSTYSDLKEYREAVYDILRKMRHDVIAMEDYVATDERPLDKCLTDVANCDLYIGIFAWRYGYIPPKDNPLNKSITELEYRQATDSKKQRRLFLLDPQAPWSPSLIDAVTGDGEKGKRITALREELGREHTAGFFKAPDELAKLVAAAVNEWEKSQPTPTPIKSVVTTKSVPPLLPVNFIARPEELQRLRSAVLSSNGSRQVALTAVEGMGGIGKSVLAAALCHAPDVQAAFPDGVIWVTIGREPGNLVAQLAAVGVTLGDAPEQYTTPEVSKDRFRALIANKTALLVLDDVWHSWCVEAFRAEAPHCRTIFTTRDRNIALSLSAQEFRLGVLTADQAEALLREWAGRGDPQIPTIAERLGYLPVALKLAGARLREGMSGQEWLDTFHHVSQMRLNRRATSRDENLQTCFALSLDQLPLADQQLYHTFGAFPEDLPVPQATVTRLWKQLQPELQDFDCQELLQEFDRLALLEYNRTTRTLLLHDLLYDYAHEQLNDRLAQTHTELLAAYNPDGKAWAQVPNDDYLYTHLAYHLHAAQRTEELRQLLFDYDWMQAKLAATDVNALVNDYDYVATDPDAQLVQGAVRLSAHVIATDRSQLRSQLQGRLLATQSAVVQQLSRPLNNTQPAVSLDCLSPTLAAPGGPLLHTLSGHSNWVTAVVVLPDGQHLVSASGDRTLKVWDWQRGQEVHTLRGHSHRVTAVVVLPDGQHLVSASDDRTLKVWDWQRGQEVHTLRGHSHGVTAVVVLPDGQHLVSASNDGTLKVWDWQRGQEVHTLRGHSDWVRAVVVLPDGQHLVSASDDGTLKVWDWQRGQEVHTLRGHSHRVTAVVVLPDGQHLVSASDDRTLKVWDWQRGQEVHTLRGHSHGVTAVVVLPDGQHLVSASNDGTLKVWDWQRGQEVHTLRGHSDWVRAVVVLPDGQHLVSASDDGTLKVWDWQRGQEVHTLRGHSDWVRAVVVLPDGQHLVSASNDGTLKVWDWQRGQEVHTLRGHSDWVRAVVVLPDGQHLVSASDDGTLKVWDWQRGQEVHTLRGHSHRVTAVVVLPDGQHLVSASDDRTLKVWDWQRGQEVHTLRGHSHGVTAVVVLPDGQHLVSASNDGTLKVWDWQRGQEVHTLRGHSDWVRAVVVLPDGQHLVSASDDGTLKVWDWQRGQEVHTLRGHSHRVTAVVVLPDGQHLVSASDDRTLKVWDWQRGQEVHTLRGHSDWVRAVVVLPDGQHLVSASNDGTLKVWDWQAGRLLATFTADYPLRACVVAPDGKTVIVGDSSGRMHFLRINNLG